METKKQTAVEWLEEKLWKLDDQNYTLPQWLVEHIEQAKAMEKAQIIRAFCEGYDHDGDNYDRAEIKYYEKTYGE